VTLLGVEGELGKPLRNLLYMIDLEGLELISKAGVDWALPPHLRDRLRGPVGGNVRAPLFATRDWIWTYPPTASSLSQKNASLVSIYRRAVE
jgi:hypothetical protein